MGLTQQPDDPPRRRGPLIRIEGVSHSFGLVTALDSVSLDIVDGEIFCLLGPSGCGKTTLMRMLAGFEQPRAGRVLLDGVDLAGTPPHRRPVNMMFQSYALFPHLSVVDNIAFGLKQAGMARAEIATRVAELVRLVQLDGLQARKPAQLSGGQKQRVALARALARQPRLLLLDEPLGALDRKIREETQFQLMHIQKQLGTTFLMVTHDQEEAMVMADRIGVMEAGRLVQVGTPEEIYERPASRSVAAFIGDINLIDGEIAGRDQDGLLTIHVEGLAGSFTARSADDLPVGAAVTLAVRPEHCRLAWDGCGANVIAARIIDIAYRGDVSMLICRAAEGLALKVAVSGAARRAGFGVGDSLSVSFAPDDARVLAR